MLSELQKLFKLIWQKKKNVITNHEHVVVFFTVYSLKCVNLEKASNLLNVTKKNHK